MAQRAAAFPGLSRLAGARHWAPSWRPGCGRVRLWGRQDGAVGTQKGQPQGWFLALGASLQPAQGLGVHPPSPGMGTRGWRAPSQGWNSAHRPVPTSPCWLQFQCLVLGERIKPSAPGAGVTPQYSLLTHLWTQSVCGPSEMGGSPQNCPRCPLQAQATSQHQ